MTVDAIPTNDEFAAAVTAATSMFGDPTRRHIYLFVRGNDRGVTAGEVAERFALHPNVARHHLDKLANGGYLEVAAQVAEGRSGRPSKRYQATAKATDLEFPARRHDLLVALLGKALSLLPRDHAEAMAEQVGYEYGQELATALNPGEGHRSMQAALHAVADALTAHGFAAHTEERPGLIAIINDACPFGEMSTQHPVICAVDRGIVRGMLHTLHGGGEPSLLSSRPQGDGVCVTAV